MSSPEHHKHTSLQSNAVVLFVVGNRAFAEKYEAQGHADEKVDLNEDCPYRSRGERLALASRCGLVDGSAAPTQ